MYAQITFGNIDRAAVLTRSIKGYLAYAIGGFCNNNFSVIDLDRSAVTLAVGHDVVVDLCSQNLNDRAFALNSDSGSSVVCYLIIADLTVIDRQS